MSQSYDLQNSRSERNSASQLFFRSTAVVSHAVCLDVSTFCHQCLSWLFLSFWALHHIWTRMPSPTKDQIKSLLKSSSSLLKVLPPEKKRTKEEVFLSVFFFVYLLIFPFSISTGVIMKRYICERMKNLNGRRPNSFVARLMYAASEFFAMAVSPHQL